MSTTDEIRDTLRSVGEGTSVPAVPDAVSFRRRVRHERRTRHSVQLGVGAAAVAALGVVGWILGAGQGADPTPRPAAPPTVAGVSLSRPVYFVRNGVLAAMDPAGDVHDLGLASGGVVGPVEDGVLALDDQSHIVRFEARHDADDAWTFRRGTPPTDQAVQNAVVSADGRTLAWTQLHGDVTVYDVASGRTTDWGVGGDASVYAVTDHDLLIANEHQALLTRDGVELPVVGGFGHRASLVHDRVSLTGGDDASRIYDVRGGTVEKVASVPGSGALSATGDAFVGVAQMRDVPDAYLWTASGSQRRLDVPDPVDVAWLDDDTAVLSTLGPDGASLWACRVRDAQCTQLRVSGHTIRVGR